MRWKRVWPYGPDACVVRGWYSQWIWEASAKSRTVHILNPFYSWCFKRSHFYIRLHRGSQASLCLWRSVMARSSSIVAPLLVLASVVLAVPSAACLDIPPIRSNSCPGYWLHLQNAYIQCKAVVSTGMFGESYRHCSFSFCVCPGTNEPRSKLPAIDFSIRWNSFLSKLNGITRAQAFHKLRASSCTHKRRASPKLRIFNLNINKVTYNEKGCTTWWDEMG